MLCFQARASNPLLFEFTSGRWSDVCFWMLGVSTLKRAYGVCRITAFVLSELSHFPKSRAAALMLPPQHNHALWRDPPVLPWGFPLLSRGGDGGSSHNFLLSQDDWRNLLRWSFQSAQSTLRWNPQRMTTSVTTGIFHRSPSPQTTFIKPNVPHGNKWNWQSQWRDITSGGSKVPENK